MNRILTIAGLKSSRWLVHGIGLSTLFILFFGFRSQCTDTWKRQDSENVRRIEQLKRILGNGLTLRSEHKNLSEHIAEKSRITQTAHMPILNAKDETAFLLDLSRIADESGFIVDDFQPRKQLKLPDFQKQTIELTFRGGHSNVCRFFEKLDELNRVIRIDKLRIDSTKLDEAYSIVIVLTLYSEFQNVAAAHPTNQSTNSSSVNVVSQLHAAPSQSGGSN